MLTKVPQADLSGVTTAAGRGFARRMALFYGVTCTIVGIYGPFMPVLLEHRGLTPLAIGVVLSLPSFIRVFSTPAIAVLFDRSPDARRLVAALALVTLLAFVGFGLATSMLAIVLVMALFALSGTALIPLTDTLAMRGVTQYGLSYGRMRLWGSVTYVLATFVGALLIGIYGPASIAPMLIGTAILVLAATVLLPTTGAENRSPTGPPVRFADVARLLRAPRFMTFLAAASLINASHAVLYGFATLHWQKLEIPAAHIGGLWAMGVIAEITLFAFAAAPLRLIGPAGMILIGAVASVLRFGLMGFNPPLWLLYGLQAMHALTFGATHLGAMQLLGTAVPRRIAGTAQGLYASATAGLVMGVAALSAGWLYGGFGEASYWIMAGLGGLALWPACLLWAQRGPMLDEAPPVAAPDQAVAGSRSATPGP